MILPTAIWSMVRYAAAEISFEYKTTYACFTFNELNLFPFFFSFLFFVCWCVRSMVGLVMSMNGCGIDHYFRVTYAAFFILFHKTVECSSHYVRFLVDRTRVWRQERTKEKVFYWKRTRVTLTMRIKEHIEFHFLGAWPWPGFVFLFSISLIIMTTTTTIAFYIFNLMYDCLIFHPILLHRFSFTATTFYLHMLVLVRCTFPFLGPFACMLYNVPYAFRSRCTHSSLCSMHSSVCLFVCLSFVCPISPTCAWARACM